MSFAAAADDIVEVGHLRVRVRVHGDGPPLLLLNGLGASLELWDPLVRCLPRVQAIAFDMPGSGQSDTPRLPLSIPGHAKLALRLLDVLGHRHADVLGFSFGGMVAQELAHMSPRRVQRLVLASTSCGWGAFPGTPAALLAIQTPVRYYSGPLFEMIAPYYVGGREGRDHTFLRSQGRERQRHPPSPRGYVYQLLAAATWSSLCWLPEILQPTLVLAGDDDSLVPPLNAQILAGFLARARLLIVPGGGHLCLVDRASELGPILEGFLRA